MGRTGFRSGIVLLLAFTCGVATTVPRRLPAQEPPAVAPRGEAVLADLAAPHVAKDGRHGVVIGVLQGPKFFVRGYGRPSRGATEVLGGAHLFEIGSITKVFTALLLSDSVASGVLRLDAPLSKYLPGSCKVATKGGLEPTLRQLANHHSALPRMPANIRPKSGLDPYREYEVDDLWALLRDMQLRRSPGSRYEYSNLGAGLLGQLIARVRGEKYEALVAERILQPLGMVDSVFVVGAEQRPRLARGHAVSSLPVPGWHFVALAPAGGLRSTMQDMLRFARACLEPPSEEFRTIFDLTLAGRIRIRPRVEVGLGWHVTLAPDDPDGERTLIWHNGQTGGYRSFLGLRRKARTAIVVLQNSTRDPGPGTLAHRILRALDAGTLELAWRARL